MSFLKSSLKFILFLWLISACKPQNQSENGATSDTVTTKNIQEESPIRYIVSIEHGYNYDSLKAIAKQAAAITYMRFDTLDRYYNPRKGIILHENDTDQKWAGRYFLRRMASNFTSIEMEYAYIDTTVTDAAEIEKRKQNTTHMFVFAMMYPSKKSADSLAAIMRPKFPHTKVFPARIFMGAMH